MFFLKLFLHPHASETLRSITEPEKTTEKLAKVSSNSKLVAATRDAADTDVL